MRIDSGESNPSPRDELRVKQGQTVAPPNWRVLAGLSLVVALAMGSYVLGRSSTAADAPERDDPVALVADVLGSTEVEATVSFGDETKAVVACSPIETQQGTRGEMRVIHIGPNGAGEQILSYTHLANVASCGACATEPLQLADEAMLLGHCDFISGGISPGPGSRRMQQTSAFVVSAPAAAGESAIGMDLLCGVTSLSVDDGQLVLEATQPIFASNPNPPTPLPPMKFTREQGAFVADDIGVLEHFCEVTPDTQLVELPAFVFGRGPQRELSHLIIQSEIGKIGFRNAVLIGLTPNQCNTLLRAQIGVAMNSSDAASLASITGLEPPEGYDDWFFTCQIDSNR